MKQSNKLKGLYIIELPAFEDERGFFKEVFRLNELEKAVGHKINFVRLNHSYSKQKVLRGIHVAEFAKLAYCLSGEIMSVIVDGRKDSPTFKQHEVFDMGDSNRIALYIPPGFGNSFYVKSPKAEYVYLVTDYYDTGKEVTVRWDDPDLNIPWPDKSPIISDRDRQAKKLSEF